MQRYERPIHNSSGDSDCSCSQRFLSIETMRDLVRQNLSRRPFSIDKGVERFLFVAVGVAVVAS